MKEKLIIALLSGFLGFVLGDAIRGIRNSKRMSYSFKQTQAVLEDVMVRLSSRIENIDPTGETRREFIEKERANGASEEELFRLEEHLFRGKNKLKS